MLRSSSLGLIGLSVFCVTACGGADAHPRPAEDASALEPSAAAALDIDGAGVSDACVGVEAASERVPVDLLAVVDGSASMGDATSSGGSKWVATKAAFRHFLERAPADMRFGLSLFPVPGDDTASCAESSYHDTALPISDVSQMAAGALAQLDAVIPRGQTPTGPALSAALRLAGAYGTEHRERSVVVVLATDGLPTTCSPTDTGALAQLAEGALRAPGHVRTLVVASGEVDRETRSGLEQIARAGGTGRALVLDPRADFAEQLADALAAAASRKVACDLAMPEPPPGRQLDYDSINVIIERDGRREALPRVSGPDACAGDGWYYDVDPIEGAASRLNVCPFSCERGASRPSAKLRVELGCKTIVK